MAEPPPIVAPAVHTPLTAAAAPTHTPGPELGFYLGPIVQRNLFNSTPPAPVGEASPEAPTIIASELPAQLISTSVASDPAWSTAMVRPSPKESARIVRVGAPLHDGVVHAILRPRIGPEGKVLPARIVLERAGHLEYLDEDNKPPRVAKKKKKRTKRRTNRRRRNRKR